MTIFFLTSHFLESIEQKIMGIFIGLLILQVMSQTHKDIYGSGILYHMQLMHNRDLVVLVEVTFEMSLNLNVLTAN